MSTPINKNLKLSRSSRASHAFRSPYRSPLTQNQRACEEDPVDKDKDIETNHGGELSAEHSGSTPTINTISQPFKLQSNALKRKLTPNLSGVIKCKSSFRTPFKSPLISGTSSCNSSDKFCKQSSETTPKRRCVPRKISISSSFARPLEKNEAEPTLAELVIREKQLDEEILLMHKDGYDVKELQTHIEKLHYYNDLKDAAQMVMGRLAQLEGTSVRAIHERYDAANLD